MNMFVVLVKLSDEIFNLFDEVGISLTYRSDTIGELTYERVLGSAT